MGSFPLWRTKRSTQNIDSVKADIKNGSTYALNRVIEIPPALITVIRNSRLPAKTVANIESRTVLCSFANFTKGLAVD
jgi:hypothetical protein